MLAKAPVRSARTTKANQDAQGDQYASTRANETLTEVRTNKLGDVTYAKYKSVMPHVTIDGVQAAPEQVKVMPPKEKKKRVPPTAQENDQKRQRMTIVVLHNKIQDRTLANHAMHHRIDQEHIYHKDLEYELTILCRYVVNKDKYQSWELVRWSIRHT